MQSRRSKPKRAERGATLFIVVLAITLLTGVGLYTVHSSSLSARAASSGRQALQAGRVTELHAVTLLSHFRRTPADIQEYFSPQDPTAPPDICEMNQGLPGTPLCRKVPIGDIAPASGAPILAADSFGPLLALSGGALMEITDAYAPPVPIPGSDNKWGYTLGVVTIIGRLDPAGMGNACVQNQMQVASQHIIRAQFMFGPMPIQ